jgi:hypothetical protein
MASNFYRQKDGPRYYLGHGLEIGFIAVGMMAAILLILGYRITNKKRDKRMQDGAETQLSPEELSAQGDRAVTWRYMF